MAAKKKDQDELIEYQVIKGKPSWDGKTYRKGDKLKLSPQFVEERGLKGVLKRCPVEPEPEIPKVYGNIQYGERPAPIPLPRVAPPVRRSDEMFPVQPPTVEEIKGLPAVNHPSRVTGEAVSTLEIERPQPHEYRVNIETVPNIEAELLRGGEDTEEEEINLDYLNSLNHKELCALRRKLGAKKTGQKSKIIIQDIRKALNI